MQRAAPTMQGSITGRDVLRHSWLIIRTWGPVSYLRCLRAAVAGKPCTFLGVLYGVGSKQQE